MSLTLASTIFYLQVLFFPGPAVTETPAALAGKWAPCYQKSMDVSRTGEKKVGGRRESAWNHNA